MEHGPLPPHERSWRHPSELAAEERAVARAETSPSIARALALTAGTVGLFAIAVVVLAVTPSDQSQPVAVSATTAPLSSAAAGSSDDSAALDGGATISAARSSTATAVPDRATLAALATPIGAGRYALVSQGSIDRRAAKVDVVLPSGKLTVGRIVERSTDTVLVVLTETEPGHDVAPHQPHEREVVTVMARPPVTIAFSDVDTLQVADGTAVVNSAGKLVGLCTKQHNGAGMRLVVVDADMATPDDDRSADTADDEAPTERSPRLELPASTQADGLTADELRSDTSQQDETNVADDQDTAPSTIGSTSSTADQPPTTAVPATPIAPTSPTGD